MIWRKQDSWPWVCLPDTQEDQPPRPHGENRNCEPAWHRILEWKASSGLGQLRVSSFSIPFPADHTPAMRVTHSLPLSFLFFFFCCCYFLCMGQFKGENLMGLMRSLLVLQDTPSDLEPQTCAWRAPSWQLFHAGGFQADCVVKLLETVVLFKKHPWLKCSLYAAFIFLNIKVIPISFRKCRKR